MRKLLLLTALIILSCSKDEIKEEPTLVDNCGEIVLKRYVISNDCYEIRFESYYNNSTFTLCIDEDEWLSLENGDEYCNGQTQIN